MAEKGLIYYFTTRARVIRTGAGVRKLQILLDIICQRSSKNYSQEMFFFSEIKNRTSSSVIKTNDEDLRLRLEKRRHVVHRHATSHDPIVDDNDNRRLSRDSSPPMKIVKIEEPEIEEQQVERMVIKNIYISTSFRVLGAPETLDSF